MTGGEENRSASLRFFQMLLRSCAAVQWCESLGGELDTTRAKFWTGVVRPRLQTKLQTLTLEDS